MAKILYAVAKEGMGHAIRGRVIIEGLSKKHKIKIITNGRPYNYLSKYFSNIEKIKDFGLVYINNSVSNLFTFLSNIFKAPFIILYNLKLIKIILCFKPEIIITDFETFGNYISYLFRIPLISIDNQQLMTKCKIEFPKKFRKDFMISYCVIKLMVNNAKKYFVTSFFFPKIKEKNVFLFYPILRKEILKLKPRGGEYILVYQTSQSYKTLFKILKKVNIKFIIYGFNKNYTEKNLTFRRFNEDVFFKDLAGCKAVITNGGFTLISEALYLKKPILSIPVRKQFEQILNAIYLDKLGYGEHHEFLTEENLKIFLANLSKYEKNIVKLKKQNYSKFLKKLEDTIKDLLYRKSR